MAAGHPVDDTQRVIMLRGLLPKSLLGRLGDLEDTHATYGAKLRWVERQLERDHAKAMADLRTKTNGLKEVPWVSGVGGRARGSGGP